VDTLEGYVGIFDMDPEYRSCLMRGLMREERLQMPLVEFTKLDSILTFAKSKDLKLLAISDMALTEELLQADIGGIILLTEEPVSQEMEQAASGVFGALFKYQPVEKIAGTLLIQYQMLTVSSAAQKLEWLPQQCLIYGVYSPVKRCLKSSFAIALAQLLGERQSTLLISFENYSALLGMLDLKKSDGGGSLSDALYYYLQGTLEKHETELVRRCHSFDVLAPVSNPKDLTGLSAEEVTGFIRCVAQDWHYSCLVIDFGDALMEMNQILGCCSRIFMPVKSDWISQEKKNQYMEYTGRAYPELLSQMEEVHPPYHHVGTEEKRETSGNFERLTSGAFYDYVRGCL
jgi:hypothetical protein